MSVLSKSRWVLINKFIFSTLYFFISLGIVCSPERVVPVMEADIMPKVDISTDIELYPGSSVLFGFDNNKLTLFHSIESYKNGQIKVVLEKPIALSKIKIITQEEYSDRAPSTLIVRASEDNKSYDEIANYKNIKYEDDNVSLDVNSTVKYKVFEFQLSNNNKYITFSEMQLISDSIRVEWRLAFWMMINVIVGLALLTYPVRRGVRNAG